MNRTSIRKLYQDAIIQIFGCGDKELDANITSAVKQDIHLGDKAPGQWSPDSVLEIYCERGIPNATDMFDPSWHGFSGKTVYNSDKWAEVDGVVNLMLEAINHTDRYYHEPYNGAIINIYKA